MYETIKEPLGSNIDKTSILINLKELAAEIFELGVVTEIKPNEINFIGCPTEEDYRDYVDGYIGDRTPMGMIIKQGALLQLHEDLHSTFKIALSKKTKALTMTMHIDEFDVIKEPEQLYEYEADELIEGDLA